MTHDFVTRTENEFKVLFLPSDKIVCYGGRQELVRHNREANVIHVERLNIKIY